MLSPLVGKTDNMLYQVGYFSIEINIIRKSNENSRNEKHSNRQRRSSISSSVNLA